MNFSLSNNHLELDFSLTKANLEIVESDRDDVELVFSELRKQTVEEVFDIEFDNDFLVIKEKTWRKPAFSMDFMNDGINTDLTLQIPSKTINIVLII